MSYVKIWRVNKFGTGLVNIHYRACDIFVTSLWVIRIRTAPSQIWISSTSTSSREVTPMKLISCPAVLVECATKILDIVIVPYYDIIYVVVEWR